MEKVTKGQQVARDMSDYVNVMCFKSDDFVNEVMNKHRTLQQSMFGVMVECIKEWSERYENDSYDARNEDTCRIANKIVTLLGDELDSRRFI